MTSATAWAWTSSGVERSATSSPSAARFREALKVANRADRSPWELPAALPAATAAPSIASRESPASSTTAAVRHRRVPRPGRIAGLLAVAIRWFYWEIMTLA